MEVSKAYDNAMNGGKVSTLACPLKSLMNEVDDNASFKKISPKGRNGNTLSNRICGDERTSRFCVVNEVGRFLEPARHIIEIAES